MKQLTFTLLKKIRPLLMVFFTLLLSDIVIGQITQRGTATTDNSISSNQLTLNTPAGVAAGDVMIVNIVQTRSSDGGSLADASNGSWIQISGSDIGSSNSTRTRSTILYRVAGGSEPSSYNFSLDGNTNSATGGLIAFYNVSNTGFTHTGAAGGPFDVIPGSLSHSGGNSNDDVACTGINGVSANAAIIMLAHCRDNSSFDDGDWFTTNPTLTELFDDNNSSNDGTTAGAAWGIRTTAGNTGDGDADLSSNELWGAMLIALRPAPAASLTPSTTQNTTVGGNVAFTATAINFGGSGDYTYDWDAPGATIPIPDPATIASSSNAKTLTFPTAGTYKIKVTISRTGATTRITNVIKVVVVANPTAPGAPTNSPAVCVDGGTAVTSNTCGEGTFSASFQNADLYFNNGNNGLSPGSIWRFTNVSNILGDQINATITVDVAYQAILTQFDDDAAQDELGNQTLQAFFAPRIDPDQSLGTTARRGFVQFTIDFWKNGWTDSAFLDLIKYSHYDIDGSKGSDDYWFRETGHVKTSGNISVSVNAGTELTAYDYVSGIDSWKGFSGTVCNRSNFSRYAQVAATFNYPIKQSSVTIRMGYDYQDLVDAGNDTYGDQAARLYASKFECFSFPEESTLPVKLISFSGSYRNQLTSLNWVTENLYNFDRFEIERSSNGSNFAAIGSKQPVNTSARTTYLYSDDLSFVNGTVFYYRLKMVDIDGAFKYSNVIMIRKDQQSITGINMSPNPVANGETATVRFKSTSSAIVNFKVVDMSGRVVLTQKNNISEGTNSVSINNLDRLQPGMYVLQMNDGATVQITKFNIVRK